MSVPVFIPYVNRPDLLRRAVDSVIHSKSVQPIVINNSGAPLEIPCAVITPPVPLTFAQTQNWMLKIASSDPFYLFLHNDAEAGLDVTRILIEKARGLLSGGKKWSVIFTNYDALAAFNTEAFLKIGGWDPFLEHYLADCDVYRRLRLAGYPTIESNLPVKHAPSQTLHADPEYRRKVDLMFPCRQAYYQAKWGGPNEYEIYQTPFNQ